MKDGKRKGWNLRGGETSAQQTLSSTSSVIITVIIAVRSLLKTCDELLKAVNLAVQSRHQRGLTATVGCPSAALNESSTETAAKIFGRTKGEDRSLLKRDGEDLSVLCSQSVPANLSGQEHSNAAVCGIRAQTPPFWHGLTPHGSGMARDEDWTKTGTEKHNISRTCSRNVVLQAIHVFTSFFKKTVSPFVSL